MLTTGSLSAFHNVTASALLLLFCLLARTVFTSPGCVKFEFPGAEIASDKLVLPKGQNIIIHYVLNTSSCLDSESKTNFTVKIAKRSDAGFNADVCKIVHNRGSCEALRPTECPCPDETGRYTITKPLAPGDETEWIWSTGNGERRIQIEQRYPLQLSMLSFHPSNDQPSGSLEVYKIGSSVDILCTFEDGKPMVEPTLWKSGQQLTWDSTSEVGKRRRRLQSVTCSDSDTYTCAAPENPQNKSAPLLVACPPIINKKRIKPESKEWKFEVKSYSKSFTSCILANADATTGKPYDCLSNHKVSGSPLSVWVTLLTSDLGLGEDVTNGGNWTLTLGTEEGQDTFNFRVPGKNDTLTTGDEDDDPDESENEPNTQHNMETSGVAGATTNSVVVLILLALTVLAAPLLFSSV